MSPLTKLFFDPRLGCRFVPYTKTQKQSHRWYIYGSTLNIGFQGLTLIFWAKSTTLGPNRLAAFVLKNPPFFRVDVKLRGCKSNPTFSKKKSHQLSGCLPLRLPGSKSLGDFSGFSNFFSFVSSDDKANPERHQHFFPIRDRTKGTTDPVAPFGFVAW